MIFEFKNIKFTLVRKRIKNINLRIQRTGEIHVSAPLHINLDLIYSFIHEKLAWINAHRSQLLRQADESPATLLTGESIYFLGHRYPIIVQEVLRHPHAELRDNQLHLFVKSGSVLETRHRLLQKWYHSQMHPYVVELIAKWEVIIGVKSNRVAIKSMRSRWGSCHPIKKHISLNLNLIKKPLYCLEYVIVHELVHILEASHNQRFYSLMDSYLPNWKEVKLRLADPS